MSPVNWASPGHEILSSAACKRRFELALDSFTFEVN